MGRSFVSRLALSSCLCAVVALSPAGVRAAAQPADKVSSSLYAHVATLPDRVGGEGLISVSFDRVKGRLYAVSNLGLYWVDANEEKPVWKGPMFKAQLTRVECAPDLGRVFFAGRETVGYVDVNALETPHAIARVWASDLVYEPSRKEIYVAYRAPRLQVFSAVTGERSGSVELPSWEGQSLEAIPGRVFLTLPTKSGLYAIDAASHHIGPWKVTGKLVTPAFLEADPSGRYLFASYHQNIVAIDTATAAIVGRVVSGSTPSIAFDPGSGLLVATYIEGPAPQKVGAFKVDAKGLTLVGAFENPGLGTAGVEPTTNGFIQRGAHSLLVWSMNHSTK